MENEEATIASLFRESSFHSQVSADDDGISDDLWCADYVTDTFEEVDEELEKKIEEARAERLNPNMIDSLKQILQIRTEVYRVRLRNDTPALVTTTKIRVDEISTHQSQGATILYGSTEDHGPIL